MAQSSKLLKSRNEWREKAIKRADEQREQRKVSKRHRETIAELKLKIEDLKQELKEVGAKKKSARAQR
jgi:phage shock protein A